MVLYRKVWFYAIFALKVKEEMRVALAPTRYGYLQGLVRPLYIISPPKRDICTRIFEIKKKTFCIFEENQYLKTVFPRVFENFILKCIKK